MDNFVEPFFSTNIRTTNLKKQHLNLANKNIISRPHLSINWNSGELWWFKKTLIYHCCLSVPLTYFRCSEITIGCAFVIALHSTGMRFAVPPPRHGPHFEDIKTVGNVTNMTVQMGQSVYLNCRISLLQDKTVSESSWWVHSCLRIVTAYLTNGILWIS